MGSLKKSKTSAGKWVAILASALGVEIGLCAVVTRIPDSWDIYYMLMRLFLLTLVALLVAFVIWLIEISNSRRF